VGDSIEQAVERAILTMQRNLGDQLTVDDIARSALFSKFHFTRIFQRTTGVSPGRFLSALRLQRAKELLVSTSLNVADISLRVGYSSVGTFSSRFSRSVGMSPTTYRRHAGFASHIPTGADQGTASTASVHARIWPACAQPAGLVFAGLFPNPIPEGRPVRCAILPRPGAVRFDNVPDGEWFLLAHSVTGDPCRLPTDDQQTSVATKGPLSVGKDSVVRTETWLQPARVLDPPVLLALLDVRKLALATVAEEQPRTPVSFPAAIRPAQHSGNRPTDPSVDPAPGRLVSDRTAA